MILSLKTLFLHDKKNVLIHVETARYGTVARLKRIGIKPILQLRCVYTMRSLVWWTEFKKKVLSRGPMEPTTLSRISQCDTMQEFAIFLKETQPTIGFLGLRRYRHIDASKSISMHTIVSKFRALCHKTVPGTVSTEEVIHLRERIVYLERTSAEMLGNAPWWKRLCALVFRITAIWFLFRNPITLVDTAASQVNRKTAALLHQFVDSATSGSLTQDQCNQITSPSLYKELISRLIENKPMEECVRLLDELPVPVSTNQDKFSSVVETARRELWATKAREYFLRLSQNPPPQADELLFIQKFFHDYILTVFSIENKSLNKEELHALFLLNQHIQVIPPRSRTDILKQTLFPYFDSILRHFCFLMRNWIEYYRTQHPKLSDYIPDLGTYKFVVNDLCPGALEATPEWNKIQTYLSKMFAEQISTHQILHQEPSFIMWDNTLRLSDEYSFSNKREINAWLASLPEATATVQDLSRELGKGVTIGMGEERQLCTTASLREELGETHLSEDDEKALLCWKFAEKASAYFQGKGMENPTEATAMLLTLANQNHPSYTFMPIFGELSDRQVITVSNTPHDWTLFFDEASAQAKVRVHTAYQITNKQNPEKIHSLQATFTLTPQEDRNTFREEIQFLPQPVE